LRDAAFRLSGGVNTGGMLLTPYAVNHNSGARARTDSSTDGLNLSSYGDYIACSHLLDVCYIVNKQIKTDPVSWRGIDVRARMDPTGGVPPYRVLRGETHRMRRIYFDQGSGQRKI
jgi:hypothetical protein